MVREVAHARKRNPLSELNKSLQGGRYPRRNHLCKFWWGSVKGFRGITQVCTRHPRTVLCARRQHRVLAAITNALRRTRRTADDPICGKVWHRRAAQRYVQQEGQHLPTGQRAANFRLLANQWAKRRLVTQWRHGCRAMRRSVCNAGASNESRSLWVKVSRERSYPLPIYWYQSKGNWLRYNFAADSCYIMKLCSRLFVLYCRNCPKDDKFR